MNNTERKFIKKNLKLFLTFLFLVIGIGGFTMVVYGETLDSLDKKINNAQDKLKENNQKEKNISNDMADINNRISETKSEIDSLTKEVIDAHDKVVEASNRLYEEKKKLNQENDNLAKRLRNIYKSGGVAFLDVILSAENTSELFSNLEMVKYIYKNDKDVVAKLKASYEKISAEREEVASMESNLKSKQEALSSKQEALGKDYDLLATKKADLNKDSEKIKNEIAQWRASSNAIKAALLKEQSKNSGGSSTSTGSATSSAKGFILPVKGVFTSEFGYRMLTMNGSTFKNLHTGLDIAAPHGTPVKASKAGKVVWAGWQGGYGNLVLIDHGNGVATAYGHNSSIAVSVGQTVSQGQVIAGVGTTGFSTGNHCHFEIRINGEPVNPRSYL